MADPTMDYAGDGVYVKNLGWAIELRANDPEDPSDTICLEPSVLEAVNRIAKRWGFSDAN